TTLGTLTLAGTIRTANNWTYTAGTLDPGTSTLVFAGGTITGSHTLNMVEIRGATTVAAGTTLTVNSTLTLPSPVAFTVNGTVVANGELTLTDGSVAGTGSVEARANLTQASTFDGGAGNLLINGTGAQTFTGSATAIAGDVPNVTINKSAGTLTLSGTLRIVAANWSYTAGTLDPGTSTVIFNGVLTVTGSHTLTNVEFQGIGIKTVAAGTTLTAGGTLTLTDGSINTGTVAAQGDVTVASTFDGGSSPLSFTGGANQAFTNGGGVIPTGTWTVDKFAGTVTLASNLTLGSSQALDITSGTLDQGASLNLTAGAITLGAGGTLQNLGTGDLTIGVIVSNSGTITLNGGGSACGDADSILIRSTVAGTQRSWSGSGVFNMQDVDVQDQAGTASITVYSGTNSGNNGSRWTFISSCPAPTSTPALTNTPTPSSTSTPTGTSTPTPTPTPTDTPTPTSTPTNTAGPTGAPTSTSPPGATSTQTPVGTSTSTPTVTPTSTPTSTDTPTSTPTVSITPTAPPMSIGTATLPPIISAPVGTATATPLHMGDVQADSSTIAFLFTPLPSPPVIVGLIATFVLGFLYGRRSHREHETSESRISR
ncbi:MAG: hypothetical protein WC941_11170, partial [Candidatus Bathyarchaeia archaeon]